MLDGQIPNPRLLEENNALRVELGCREGPGKLAETNYAKFLRRFPNSAYAPSLAAACQQSNDQSSSG